MSAIALEKVDFEPVRKKGVVHSDWMVSHNKPIGESAVNFEISGAFFGLERCFNINIDSDIKWLRIVRPVDPALLNSSFLRIRLRYAAESAGSVAAAPIGKVGIFKRDSSGHYTIFSLAGDSVQVTPVMREIDAILRFGEPLEDDATYFLTLEFNKRAAVRVLDFSLSKDDADSIYVRRLAAITTEAPDSGASGGVAPYRVADFAVSKQLIALNDSMDREIRAKPLVWLGGMLKVALRLEDYETAVSLVDHILLKKDFRSNEFSGLIESICTTCVATGEISRLHDIAMQIAVDVSGPARLKILKPIIRAIGEDFNSLFEINNKIEADIDGVRLVELLSVLDASDGRHLLLSNYFRQRDEVRQVQEINAYLRSFRLPYEIVLNDGAGNFLSRVGFKWATPIASDPTLQEGNASDFQHKPLVSVFIAAHNCEETIEYAVKSILNQSYKNIEILIADDSSTDGTLKALEIFSNDPRVRVYRSHDNQGPYNIRNALAKFANGEFITIHDADDLALPHRVEQQVQAMMDQGTFVSLGRWLRVNPNGHFVAFSDNQFLRMCVNSIMFHRKVFEIFGPYRSVMFGADSEFFEAIKGRLGRDKITQIESPSVLGLWSSSSLTKTPGIEANERGFRAEKRRLYAALAGRQRILGKHIIPDEMVEQSLKSADIYRAPQALELA